MSETTSQVVELLESVSVYGWNGQRAFEVYSSQTSFLLGKVLTTIDAAVTDKQQNKAVKDLIKQQFRDQEKYVDHICWKSDGIGSVEVVSKVG